jgi:hypothetical protein
VTFHITKIHVLDEGGGRETRFLLFEAGKFQTPVANINASDAAKMYEELGKALRPHGEDRQR